MEKSIITTNSRPTYLRDREIDKSSTTGNDSKGAVFAGKACVPSGSVMQQIGKQPGQQLGADLTSVLTNSGNTETSRKRPATDRAEADSTPHQKQKTEPSIITSTNTSTINRNSAKQLPELSYAPEAKHGYFEYASEHFSEHSGKINPAPALNSIPINSENFESLIMELIDNNQFHKLAQIPKKFFELLPKENDIQKTTFLHYAIEKNHEDCVQVIQRKSPKQIEICDSSDLRPLELAAVKGHLKCLKAILEDYPKDDLPYCSNHLVLKTMKQGHLDCLNYLLEHPAVIQNVDYITKLSPLLMICQVKNPLKVLKLLLEKCPDTIKIDEDLMLATFQSLSKRGIKDCVDFFLKNPSFIKHLTEIKRLPFLTYASANYPLLYEHARQQSALPKKPASDFDLKKYKALYHQNQLPKKWGPENQLPQLFYGIKANRDKSKIPFGSTIDRFDLIQEQGSSTHIDQAKALLQSLGNIGVFIRICIFDGEKQGSYYSLGDESACIQIMDELIKLGTQNITLWLSRDPRSARFGCGKHPILSKLAMLLPEIDIENNTTIQTLERQGVKLTVVPPDVIPPHIPPHNKIPLTFSFCDVHEQYKESNRIESETYITVKPYRFASEYQYMLTDIHDQDQGNLVPLHLPANAIIPKSENHKLQAVNPDYPGANAVNKILSMSETNQTHLAVVYGVHHEDIDSEPILSVWLKGIKEQLSASNLNAKELNDSRPVLVVVFPNNKKTIADFLEIAKEVHDTDTIDICTDKALDQLSNLPAGTITLAKMPSLPKSVFEKMVSTSDYPVLTEGANLTSYLLQSGHPHLSVFPNGKTPVAQDMGDPFEAMKCQALSYKLSINEDESKLLTHLLNLIQLEQYEEAIATIESNRTDNLRFLWEGVSPKQQSQAITVTSLLRKCMTLKKQGKTLGQRGMNTLLATIDPSAKTFASYIESCLDSGSDTVHHSKLQQMHVNRPINHSVVTALVKYAHYKGLI